MNPSTLHPRRILVRGVNWLGDAIMTTPALLRLREHFPDALIALLTPLKLQGLWLHHPAIDEIITFGSDENALKVARKIKVIMWPEASGGDTAMEPSTGGAFDLALVLPNSPRSAIEMWLAGIPERVGYARPWRNLFLTTAIPSRPGEIKMRKRTAGEIKRLIASGAPAGSPPSPPATAHQIYDYLHLVGALGANSDPLPPQIVVTPGEVRAVARKFNLESAVADRRVLLGLNPGAEYGPAKRWPADRFIAAALDVQHRTGCLWILFGGKEDVAIAAQIEAGIGSGSVLNLAGKTSLRELCATIKLCRAVLTNDTGPMHIAAALGVPVIVPFGSTSPDLTGPINTGNVPHRLLRSDAPCSPCFLRTCPIDFRCMNGISVEQVVSAIVSMI